MPSSAAVKSVAGDVNVELSDPANVDIYAQSTQGLVKSELPRLFSENGHVLQARVGTGGQTLRINSDSGNVVLTKSNEQGDSVARSMPESPEPLNEQTQAKGAGIPAPVLDAQEISEGDVIRVDSQLVTLNMSVTIGALGLIFGALVPK